MKRDGRRAAVLAALAVVLAVPSAGTLERYAGTVGLIAYGAALVPLLWLAQGPALRWLKRSVSPRTAERLGLAAFWVLVVLFAFLFPLADSGWMGGGSDRDEALDLATRELLAGRYPYTPLTYLGNRITPMPGALLLAAPWVVLGTSSLGNVFWLALFAWWLAATLRDSRSALLLGAVLFVLCPAATIEWLAGGDYVVNALYVTILLGVLVRWVPDRGRSRVLAVGCAVLFGLALSSRANYVLLLPLLWGALDRRAGRKDGALYTLIAGGTAAAVTLPFLLYDPAGFSPLHTAATLAGGRQPHPLLGGLLLAATAFVALAAGALRVQGVAALFAGAAAVQAMPVLAAVLLSSLAAGTLLPAAGGYGIAFLFFGALAAWMTLAGGAEAGAR